MQVKEFDDLQGEPSQPGTCLGGFAHVKEGRESSNVYIIAFVLLCAVFVVVA